MILNKETHARNLAGGGYEKVPYKNFKKEDKCSPSFNEGWCQTR